MTKRWVVRAPIVVGLDGRVTVGPDITVQAERQTIEHGVLVFERWEEVPVFEDVKSYHPVGQIRREETIRREQVGTESTLVLVRAFGVGQWRDVEPLADPEPEHTGVVREPGSITAKCMCGHLSGEHAVKWPHPCGECRCEDWELRE